MDDLDFGKMIELSFELGVFIGKMEKKYDMSEDEIIEYLKRIVKAL